MTLQLTAVDYALCLAQVLTEAALIVFVYRLFFADKFSAWRIYLSFDLASSVVMLACCIIIPYSNPLYAQVWWSLQLLDFLIVCIVCLQLLAVALPQYPSMVTVYGIATGVLMLFVLSYYFPPMKTSQMLIVAANASRLCGFLLLMAVMFIKKWPRCSYAIAVGMVFKIIGARVWAALYEWSVTHQWRHFVAVRYCYEVLALATVIVWFVAVWGRKGNMFLPVSEPQI